MTDLDPIKGAVCLDLIPMAEVCGVVGGAPGAGFCETFIEPIFGALGFGATEYQIIRDCLSRGMVDQTRWATAVNLASAAIDFPLPILFLDEEIDLALFYLTNEIVRTCENGKE